MSEYKTRLVRCMVCRLLYDANKHKCCPSCLKHTKCVVDEYIPTKPK